MGPDEDRPSPSRPHRGPARGRGGAGRGRVAKSRVRSRESCRAPNNFGKPPASSCNRACPSYTPEVEWRSPTRETKRCRQAGGERPTYPWSPQRGGKGTIPDKPSAVVRLLFQPRGRETGDEPAFRSDAVREMSSRNRRALFAGQSGRFDVIPSAEHQLWTTASSFRIQSNCMPLHGDARATIEALIPFLIEAGAGDRPSPAEAVTAARRT